MLNSFTSKYNKFIFYLNILLKWLIILILFALTVVVLMQVFFRYVMFASLPWSEEVSRYLQIWLVMIAAAYGFSYGEHIEVEFFKEKLQDRPLIYKVITSLIYILLLVVLYIFVTNSFDFASRVEFQRTPALRISMLWPTLALPVGGLLMMLQVVKLLLNTMTGRDEFKVAGKDESLTDF